MEKSEIIKNINTLRKEKNAIILSHFYQDGDIQDIADFIGDSLALTQWAAKTTADIIVLCGVHFMEKRQKLFVPKNGCLSRILKQVVRWPTVVLSKNFNSLSMNIPIIRLFHI